MHWAQTSMAVSMTLNQESMRISMKMRSYAPALGILNSFLNWPVRPAKSLQLLLFPSRSTISRTIHNLQLPMYISIINPLIMINLPSTLIICMSYHNHLFFKVLVVLRVHRTGHQDQYHPDTLHTTKPITMLQILIISNYYQHSLIVYTYHTDI